jgi:hypothetical protein
MSAQRQSAEQETGDEPSYEESHGITVRFCTLQPPFLCYPWHSGTDQFHAFIRLLDIPTVMQDGAYRNAQI